MYGTSNAGLTSLTDDRETPILALSVFICRVCITNWIAVRPLYPVNRRGNAAGFWFENRTRFTRWKFPMTVFLGLIGALLRWESNHSLPPGVKRRRFPVTINRKSRDIPPKIRYDTRCKVWGQYGKGGP